MASFIPFRTSLPFHDFTVTLARVEYRFDVRWNSREGAWYFDVSETDAAGTKIAEGIKVVLGIQLGRRIEHPLFRDGVLVAVDLDGRHRAADPGIDELGVSSSGVLARVQVMHLTMEEWLAIRIDPRFGP